MSVFSQYLKDPLDEQYLVVPGDTIEEKTLPAQELEVRRALYELKLIALRADDLNWFSRLFKTGAYEEWHKDFSAKKMEVKALIFSSNLHRAAYHRIRNAVSSPARSSDKTLWDFINADAGKQV